ncbi:MAG: efflux RND transporter periplasmic adaptor subunit [Candidatus Levyibacteriota bacterium]
MSNTNLAQQRPKTIRGRFNALSLGKRLIIVVVVLAILGFSAFQVFGQNSAKPQYQTATVQKGSVISTVSESGNVNAGSQTQVTSPSNGLIQDVYVKDGDTVSAGDKLFLVKSTATPQEKASAYANYMQALASYNTAVAGKQTAQATLEKDRDAILTAQDTLDNFNSNPDATNPTTKKPYTQNEKDDLTSAVTSAQETFTADQTKYTQQDTAIGAASAQLSSANLSYQATQNSTVTAPIGGTVANLAVVPGTAVTASNNTSSSTSTSFSSSNSSSSNANSSSSNGTAVLAIGNYGQLSILTQVNEVDIPHLKPGEDATVTLDAFPNQTFVGKVQSVDSVGTITSGVVTYNVYISLVEPPTSIKSGMTASVAIQTGRHDDVLFVPTAAIQTANGSSYVRVLKDGKVTQQTVTTGLASDNDTEITSGLNEGDTVVTSVVTTRASGSSSAASPFSGITGGRGGGGGGFGGGAGGRGGGGGFGGGAAGGR